MGCIYTFPLLARKRVAASRTMPRATGMTFARIKNTKAIKHEITTNFDRVKGTLRTLPTLNWIAQLNRWERSGSAAPPKSGGPAAAGRLPALSELRPQITSGRLRARCGWSPPPGGPSAPPAGFPASPEYVGKKKPHIMVGAIWGGGERGGGAAGGGCRGTPFLPTFFLAKRGPEI